MENGSRLPVFELHIRPMFRLLDREHMLTLFDAGFDLWELERVWEMRNDILNRLRRAGDRNMPGVGVGGPWPSEWIDLFERWTQNPTTDDIGHHLVLARPNGPYELQPAGQMRRLRTTVAAPSPGCRAWFSLDDVSVGRREYTLYLEPAMPAQAPGETPIPVDEVFVPDGAATLLIQDAAGTHELSVS